jgi:hypothetical protein
MRTTGSDVRGRWRTRQTQLVSTSSTELDYWIIRDENSLGIDIQF